MYRRLEIVALALGLWLQMGVLAMDPAPTVLFQSDRECMRYCAMYLGLPTDDSALFKLALDTSTSTHVSFHRDEGVFIMYAMHWFDGWKDTLRDSEGNIPIFVVLKSKDGSRIVGYLRGWAPMFIGHIRDNKDIAAVSTRRFINPYYFYYLSYEWNGSMFECVEQSSLASIYDEEPVIHKRKPNRAVHSDPVSLR